MKLDGQECQNMEEMKFRGQKHQKMKVMKSRDQNGKAEKMTTVCYGPLAVGYDGASEKKLF